MWIELFLLLGGLVLIVKGGDLFVAAAVRLAEFLRMPRVVIGSTLVSLATTTPELVVSVMGRDAWGIGVGGGQRRWVLHLQHRTYPRHHGDDQAGGCSFPFAPNAAPRDVRVWCAPVFDDAGFFLERWQGGVLIVGGITYFIWDFWQHWRDRKPEDIAEATAIEKDINAMSPLWVQTRIGTATQFLLGTCLVVIGSRLLVDGAVGMAVRLGVPSIGIGLTVVAVGTSLPELVTAITSSRKSVSDLAVGNVLGANIANLSLVIGSAALIQSVGMDRLTQIFNFPAMLIIMALLLWVLRTGHRVTRCEGVVLLGVYALYLVFLVGLTVFVAK